MTLIVNLGTPQFFIFQTITSLIIIISCLSVYLKTREFFNLSYQKGIKYYNNAFLAYTITFITMYLSFLLDFFYKGIFHVSLFYLLDFIMLYTGAVGGFYLAYSMMWRKFEADRIKRKHPLRILGFNLIAFFIAVFETYLDMTNRSSTAFVFFFMMIILLSTAIIINYILNLEEKRKFNDYFLSTMVLALGTYIAFFIGTLAKDIIPTTHYYVWGLVTVFFHAVAHNVSKITKA